MSPLIAHLHSQMFSRGCGSQPSFVAEARPGASLVRLEPRGFSYAKLPAAHWVHRGCIGRSISRPDLCRYHFAVPPRRFSVPDSTVLSATPSSELLRLPRLAQGSRKSDEHTCLDFRPRRGITRVRPHSCADSQIPAYVPSSGFRNLSTVFSALTLAGLFHPAATSRTLLFKVFSSRAATSPRRREHAPLPLFTAHSSPK
jgi:hypothetical protein